jgi:hypothetical protein
VLTGLAIKGIFLGDYGDYLTQWFSNYLARGTLKETKNISRHLQANSGKKTLKFRLVEKKITAPFKFLMAPQGAAAHSLKTTDLT